MAKSSTLWVSVSTKQKADRMRGKMSYNKHYDFLMNRVSDLEKALKGQPVTIRKIEKVESLDTTRILSRMDSIEEKIGRMATGSTNVGDLAKVIYAMDSMRKAISMLADQVNEVSRTAAKPVQQAQPERIDYDRIRLITATEAKKVMNSTFDDILASVEDRIGGLTAQIEKVQKAAAAATAMNASYDYCTVCGTYTTDAYHWRMHSKVPNNPFTMLV